jgi:carbamate kinase
LNWQQPDQILIDEMTKDEAQKYLNEGHFAPGSMKPKIEAILGFLERGGTEAIVTNPENIARALAGETGTRIIA